MLNSTATLNIRKSRKRALPTPGSRGRRKEEGTGSKSPASLTGFPGGASGKEHICQCRRHKRRGFSRLVEKIPWRRAWQPTPIFLPGQSHGQKNLVGYSPRNCKELDTTEVTYTHTHNFIFIPNGHTAYVQYKRV